MPLPNPAYVNILQAAIENEKGIVVSVTTYNQAVTLRQQLYMTRERVRSSFPNNTSPFDSLIIQIERKGPTKSDPADLKISANPIEILTIKSIE